MLGRTWGMGAPSQVWRSGKMVSPSWVVKDPALDSSRAVMEGAVPINRVSL